MFGRKKKQEREKSKEDEEYLNKITTFGGMNEGNARDRGFWIEAPPQGCGDGSMPCFSMDFIMEHFSSFNGCSKYDDCADAGENCFQCNNFKYRKIELTMPPKKSYFERK